MYSNTTMHYSRLEKNGNNNNGHKSIQIIFSHFVHNKCIPVNAHDAREELAQMHPTDLFINECTKRQRYNCKKERNLASTGPHIELVHPHHHHLPMQSHRERP